MSPGKYREYFQPVVLHKASLFNDPRMYIDITVETPRYSGQILGRDTTVDINQGHYGDSYIRVKNTGNVSWYDDAGMDSAPSGTLPTMLVTYKDLLHYHPFGYLWGSNRNVPARKFESVHNSDGSLASNQQIVAPGQWAIFTVDFYVPSAARDQLRRDYFVVVGREKISGHWKIIQYSGTQTYLQVKVD
jgi:hypothetical protein